MRLECCGKVFLYRYSRTGSAGIGAAVAGIVLTVQGRFFFKIPVAGILFVHGSRDSLTVLRPGLQSVAQPFRHVGIAVFTMVNVPIIITIVNICGF